MAAPPAASPFPPPQLQAAPPPETVAPPPAETFAPPPSTPSPPPEVVSPPPPQIIAPPPLTPSPPPVIIAPPPSTPSPPPPVIITPPPETAAPPTSATPPPPLVPPVTPPPTSPPPEPQPPPQPPSSSTPPPPRVIPAPPPEEVIGSPPPEPSPSPPSPLISPPPEPQPEPPTSSPSPPLTPPAINTSTPAASPPPPARIAALTPPPPARSGGNSSSPPGLRESGSSSSSSTGVPKAGVIAGVTAIAGFLVLLFVGCLLWMRKRRRRKAKGFFPEYGNIAPSPAASSQASELPLSRTRTFDQRESSSRSTFPSSPSDIGRSRPLFSYEELVAATDGFSRQNLLGEGGFGPVYKGRLPDGRVVAVKQLKKGGGQGEREFRAELESISRIHHRHLVSLVGYCISDQQRLLIYDYVPNNTLNYHLHGVGMPVMIWATRLKVAAGAARGIAYLHEDCHPRIIHRDIKSSNILLDHNFEAQVSDFGLAKLAMDSFTHVTTRVMGTFGYLAPEYASTGKLTDKSDVFSFGVVLLELITGRKPVDVSQPIGDESLVEWARPLMSHALETEVFDDLVDPRLGQEYNRPEMFRMIEVAAACVRHSATMRPRMGQVVRALEGLGQSDDLHNGLKPGQSELFFSAPHSEEVRIFRRMAFGNQDYSTDISGTTSGSQ